jgi:hypothetical protein
MVVVVVVVIVVKAVRVDVFIKVPFVHKPWFRDAQILQKSESHLKILGARRATQNEFHTEDPHILESTVKDSVITAT